MSDELVKGLLCNAAINFYAISAPNTVEQARRLHDASPVCTAALGRSLMAASMLGCMLKVPDGEVSFMVKGGGPAGNIVCVGRPDASVKGYITTRKSTCPPAKATASWTWAARSAKTARWWSLPIWGSRNPMWGSLTWSRRDR